MVPSAAATTLVFLQNDAGAKRWPVTKEKLAAVRKGFRGGRGGKAGDDDSGGDRSDDSEEEENDEDDEDATDARKMEAARKKRAAGGARGGGPSWDPDAVLFFGVGSGKRWGVRPADWIIDAAGDVIEDHWVGDDPEDVEDEEPPESGDEGEGEEGSGDDDEDEEEEEEEAVEVEVVEEAPRVIKRKKVHSNSKSSGEGVKQAKQKKIARR